MRSNKLNWWWRGAVSYDTDYQTLLARGTALGYTLPSAALKAKQSALIVALKAAGVWTLIDVLYVFRNNDATLGNFSLLNWKAPSSFACTIATPPTYGTSGYKGNGTTQFISTNWIPNTNGVNYTTNNASMFGYQTENTNALEVLWGSSDAAGVNSTRFVPRNTDLWVYNLNSTSSDSGANVNATGFWQVKRTDVSNMSLFKTGSSVDTAAVASSGMPAVAVSLLAYNVNGTNQNFSTSTIGCYGAGSSMSSQQSSDLYTAFNNYFNSL